MPHAPEGLNARRLLGAEEDMRTGGSIERHCRKYRLVEVAFSLWCGRSF